MALLKSSIICRFALVLGLFGHSSICPNLLAASPSQHLNIFTHKENGIIHFYVQNLELGSVTATLDLHLVNLTANTSFPLTTTLSGNQTVEAFTLSPTKPDAPWNYSYNHSSVLGSAVAVPNETCVYQLPYAPGSSFRVSQGYHGAFSHRGPDEYAIDWRMPIGTPIHAARDGIVVQSKDDQNEGGPDRKFEKSANCLLIQHSDGTIGIYGHLKQGGNQVQVGDHVKAGDFIALSGNTGFTSGPHLHFAVIMAKDGKERLSLPVKFCSAGHRALTLESGRQYTAAPVGTPEADAPTLASNDHLMSPISLLRSLQ